jgi:hypothetical protein
VERTAEMGEEEEEEVPVGVGGAVHPEGWKYLCIEMESTVAPSAPQYEPFCSYSRI